MDLNSSWFLLVKALRYIIFFIEMDVHQMNNHDFAANEKKRIVIARMGLDIFPELLHGSAVECGRSRDLRYDRLDNFGIKPKLHRPGPLLPSWPSTPQITSRFRTLFYRTLSTKKKRAICSAFLTISLRIRHKPSKLLLRPWSILPQFHNFYHEFGVSINKICLDASKFATWIMEQMDFFLVDLHFLFLLPYTMY
jgi:hypothetical protein